jgi:uncharacterized protein (TIGR02301 family)
MKFVSGYILAGVSILALGSAMAVAQTAPQEAVTAPQLVDEAPAPAPADESMEQPAQEVAPDSSDGPVEDAPVDTPSNGGAEWTPGIDQEAMRRLNEAQSQSGGSVSARPRKALSDGGDGPTSPNSWSQASAEAQLLARGNRRERPIDPAKRADLTRLSRVMGALHALRVSCGGRDDQTYRSRMATLLDLEAPSNGALRDPLVDAFNGGFQTSGRGAGACPADQRGQEATLAKEGLVLARKLASQYRPAPKVAATTLPPANQPRQNIVSTVPAKTAPTRTSPAPNARPSWNGSTSN